MNWNIFGSPPFCCNDSSHWHGHCMFVNNLMIHARSKSQECRLNTFFSGRDESLECLPFCTHGPRMSQISTTKISWTFPIFNIFCRTFCRSPIILQTKTTNSIISVWLQTFELYVDTYIAIEVIYRHMTGPARWTYYWFKPSPNWWEELIKPGLEEKYVSWYESPSHWDMLIWIGLLGFVLW